jgi:hypothetical protein
VQVVAQAFASQMSGAQGVVVAARQLPFEQRAGLICAPAAQLSAAHGDAG